MDPTELLLIGSARGGRRPSAELEITVVRALIAEDLPALTNPPPVGSVAPTVQALRASHHQLAQLLARGASPTEAALITGYSISRISILQSDPTFAELLASYNTQRELVFADTLDRMRVLGLSTLDELQERLESDPARWTNRELMEMADLMLVKPRQLAAGANAGGLGGSNPSPTGVVVNVKFVSSETPSLTIDGQASEPQA